MTRSITLPAWSSNMVELSPLSLTTESNDERDILLARFRALIENSAEGIATMNRDGEFLFHSGAAERILGIGASSMVGAPFFARIHEDDRAAAISDFQNLLASPRGHAVSEFRFLHGDGSWHQILSHKTNLLDDAAVSAIVSNYRDVTQQRESERALRESEERFREMAEHIKEAFFVTDLSSRRPLYVSPTWSDIWGRPLSDGYDPDAWTLAIHPDDQTAMTSALERNAGGEPTDVVFRLVRPDCTFRWVRCRAFPVQDHHGTFARIVGVCSDITALREAEERFTQAQKMEAVGRLAGGVAHDFNNLLTVIIAEADMLIASHEPGHKDDEVLREIRSAGESAVALTRQLLSFSRRELVEPVTFPIEDAVAHTSKMLRRVIGEDVGLTVKLSSNSAQVRMDRGQLDQVLTNLAINARDAMPNGGALTIATSLVPDASHCGSSTCPGERVIIAVTDTGTGMTPDVRARAFEPFFTTKPLGKGTGLGLATCHGIVAQAGGEITIESTPGAGTTFRICLPRADRPGKGCVTEPVNVPRGRESILFVEDDPGVRRVGARMLRSYGYKVHEANDANEAQCIIRDLNGSVDLLLTDVVMPGMSGRELSDLVRAQWPGIRVLFATGYTDDMIVQHQVLAHDVALLRKPYTAHTLAVKVRETLDAAAYAAA
jgi:PAS domain S-box-containing protein